MMPRLLLAGLSIAALFFAAGCSGSAERHLATGEVLLDGKPLVQGMISFLPEDGRFDAGVGAVRDGTFSLEAKAGIKRVEIEATMLSDKTEPSAIDGKPVRVRVSIIPKFYNRASILKAEVQPGGANQFRFELKSDFAGSP